MPQTIESSGLITSDAAVKASAGFLYNVTIIPDGTNVSQVTIFDDPDSANGTVLAKVQAKIVSHCQRFARPVAAKTGIWCELTGTGPNAIVHFE